MAHEPTKDQDRIERLEEDSRLLTERVRVLENALTLALDELHAVAMQTGNHLVATRVRGIRT